MIARAARRYLRLGCAFALGFLDGWRQPIELSTSRNVGFLMGQEGDGVRDAQDRGVNVGQVVRAGRRSQAWREGWWPRPVRK